MARICPSCKKEFNKPPFVFVSCICCNRVFHCTQECTKLSPEEIKALDVPNCALDFSCHECRNDGGVKARYLDQVVLLNKQLQCFAEQFGSVKNACDTIKCNQERVTNIEESVVPEIKSDIINLKDCMQASPSFTVWEFCEREKRAKNAIIYKLADNNKIEEDEAFINDALSKLPTPILAERITRIGDFKKKKRNEARPLLICFKTKEEAALVFKNKIFPEPLKLTRDRTQLQRDELSSTLDELKSRIEKGEKDAHIEYFEGRPEVYNTRSTKRKTNSASDSLTKKLRGQKN